MSGHNRAQRVFDDYDSIFNEVIRFDSKEAFKYLLLQEAHIETNEDKVDYLINAGVYYYKTGQTDSSLFFLEKSAKFVDGKDETRLVDIAKFNALNYRAALDFKKSNNVLIKMLNKKTFVKSGNKAILYNIVIANYISQEEYDSALLYCDKTNEALSYSEVTDKIKKLRVLNYVGMGNIMLYKSKYDSAIYYYTVAVDHLPEGDIVLESRVNSCLAEVFSIQEKYDKAIAYYQSSIELLENSTSYYTLCHAYYNLGEAYVSTNLDEKGLVQFRKADSLSKAINYPLIRGHALSGIGECFARTDQLDSAIVYLLGSSEQFYSVNNTRGLFLNYASLVDYYVQAGRVNEAKSFVDSLDVLLIQNSTLELNSQYHKAKSRMFQGVKNVDSAVIHLQLHHALEDSMKSLEVLNNINKIENAYELQMKDKENQKLKIELKNQELTDGKRQLELRSFYQLLGISSLSFILLLGFVWNVARLRKQKLRNKQQELTHAQEIEKLLQEKLNQTTSELRQTEKFLKISESQKEWMAKDKASILNEHLEQKKEWTIFITDFEVVYPEFFKNAQALMSKPLTPNDKKMLAFIKLGLSNKEVAEYTNVAVDSVKKSKSRLYKKLNVEGDVSKVSDVIRGL